MENYAKIDKLTKALQGMGIVAPRSENSTPPPGKQPETVPATTPVQNAAPTRKPAAPPSPQEAPEDQNADPAKKAGWKWIRESEFSFMN